VEAYYPDADFIMLRKAYYFAEKAHEGQKRSSGEDYIIHPLNVAATLIKLRMDLDSIIAGLLMSWRTVMFNRQLLKKNFHPRLHKLLWE